MPRRAKWRGVLLVVVAVFVHGDAALAAWSSNANGAATAKARIMPAGNQPTAHVSGGNVTVGWSPSSFTDGPGVSGYAVKRYSTSGAVQPIGAGCSGTIGGLGCTETNVPPGDWRYAVTPREGAWTGSESPVSEPLTVVGPLLSLSATAVTSLPFTLGGSISDFEPGQAVSFRLDDPTSGTPLTGSITPTPVPASGSASVNVTIPAGTANGPHTVYASGSNGDTASGTIDVAVPTLVRHVGTASCGSTSLELSIPAPGVPAGDTLILRLVLRDSATGTVAASDSAANAYAIDHSVVNAEQRVAILRTRVTTPLTSGDMITVTFPPATASVLSADQFSGIATSPVDVIASGTGTGLLASASVTTTHADDLLIGAVSSGAQAAVTQPAGWTSLTGQTGSCSSAVTSVGARRLVSAVSTYTYDPVLANLGAWALALVAYKAG
jgi:hypothetical protein